MFWEKNNDLQNKENVKHAGPQLKPTAFKPHFFLLKI